jgi:hypothetical protein
MLRTPSRLPALRLLIHVFLSFLILFSATGCERKANVSGYSHQYASESVSAAERKLTRTASVDLSVDDLAAANAALEKKVAGFHGEIVKSTTSASASGQPDRIVASVRVPAAQLDAFLKDLHSLAVRVTSESVETVDVTDEYIDTDAKLRNLKAAERQYLELLKRARSVEETLKITEKLTETRAAIDSTQGSLDALNKQIESSIVNITMSPDANTRVLGIYWRPLANLKLSVRGLMEGVVDYLDVVVGFLVRLPLYLLWFVTGLVVIAATLRIALTVLRFFWKRGWFRLRPHS